MTENKRMHELATKWLAGTITNEEKKEFSQWYNSYDDEYFRSSAPGEDALAERIFSGIVKKAGLGDEATAHSRRIRWRWSLGIAASFLVVILIAFLYHTGKKANSIVNTRLKTVTLTLANGHTIALNTNQKGITTGNDIRYLNGDAVVFAQPAEVRRAMQTSANQNLRLTTPKGVIYQLLLPDSSRVTLNAGSTLIYPVKFSTDERVVELEGEAFFEITKLNMPAGRSKAALKKQDNQLTRVPFKVKTAGQMVEVLGTKFNVNAYMDDRTTQTTLVEGSVKVSAGEGNTNTVKLLPGEQAISGVQGISTRAVDTEYFTSWLNGYFAFDNAGIPDVMAQMQRWYDFDIYYDSIIPDQIFSGKIPRNLTLAQALSILRKAGINIRLTNNRQVVIASPLKNQ